MKTTILIIFLLLFCCLPAAAVSDDALRMEAILHDSDIPAREDMETRPDIPTPIWHIGDEKHFFVLDPNTGTAQDCTAAVIYKGENIVFWLDRDYKGPLSETALQEMKAVDSDIIPFMHETFGHEADPGIDNDPLIHALFSNKIGSAYLGYFASEDCQDPAVHPTSNGMDLFMLNPVLITDPNCSLSGTFAHEFEHMIHHAHDGNEELFIDEGLAELAASFINEEDVNSFARSWLSRTDLSLIRWPVSGDSRYYYGNAFLFMRYIYDTYGSEMIRKIIRESSGGPDGVDQALPEIGFDRLFFEWSTAILAELIGQNQYGYTQYTLPTEYMPPDITTMYPISASGEHSVPQYGLDLYRINCSELPCTIRVEHAPETPLLGIEVQGENVFWSAAAENADTVIEYACDLSNVGGNIVLDYSLSFDIEKNMDHLYLYIRDGSDEVMARNYTGTGTVKERIDLSEFAGKEITLRFVYATDTAYLGDGALLADCSVSADGVGIPFTDMDADGWVPFVNRIPLYVGSVFFDGSHAPRSLRSGADEPIEWVCSGDCAFSVSAMSRYSRLPGDYTLSIELQQPAP